MRAADKDFIDFALGAAGSAMTFIAGSMLLVHIPKTAFTNIDLTFALVNVHIAGWLLMAGSALIFVKCFLKHVLTTTSS